MYEPQIQKPSLISEVYERYKHLDYLLSDPEWLPDNIQGKILFDLWMAVKAAREESYELLGD